jgi:putative ABC transport system substrate-binding protein
MRRREFIVGLGGAVAWPVVARAQQTPVIGYLSFRSAESDVSMLAAFRRGLNGAGWGEGRNVAIEYRFADGQVDRVRALGMELTARRVAVIVLVGLIANDEVFEFMKASRIPIVFNTGADPVHYGLVSSLNRPGGNLTGINTLVSEMTTKHIEFLHYVVPNAKTIAALVDSGGYGLAEETDARKAAAAVCKCLFFVPSTTVRSKLSLRR